MTILDFPIANIKIKGCRELRDAEALAALAESIGEVGLLHPIMITPKRTLIAGRHRLEACKLLGWETIPAIVSDEFTEDHKDQVTLLWRLARIDENLVRFDLTALERAEVLAERKEIYEKLHPNAPTGSGRLANKTAVDAVFSKDTAGKMGMAERTIREDIQIAKSITAEAKEIVRGTLIADNKSLLLVIARTEPENQVEVAQDLIRRGEDNPFDDMEESEEEAGLGPIPQAAPLNTAIRKLRADEDEFDAPPMSRRSSRTTYLLDDKIKLSGPRDALEQRITIVPSSLGKGHVITIETKRFEIR